MAQRPGRTCLESSIKACLFYRSVSIANTQKAKGQGGDLVSKVLVSKTEGLEFNPQNPCLKKNPGTAGGKQAGGGGVRVAHTVNPSTSESEAGGSLCIQASLVYTRVQAS